MPLCFTGTGESVPSGQVRSVWIETDVVFFLVTLDVMVVAEETIEAAVLLEEVFADCSERTAFLALGNEIPCSTFIRCTLFFKLQQRVVWLSSFNHQPSGKD